MKNNTVEQFLEYIEVGQEAYLIFQGRKYLVQGWHLADVGKEFMKMDDISDVPPWKPTWHCIENTMEACARTFLNAPIFDGRSFLLAHPDIEWVDE